MRRSLSRLSHRAFNGSAIFVYDIWFSGFPGGFIPGRIVKFKACFWPEDVDYKLSSFLVILCLGYPFLCSSFVGFRALPPCQTTPFPAHL